MAVRHYTREELIALRSSPLVQKPENLPAIEQWLEYVYADPLSREKLRIPHSEASTQTAQQSAGGNLKRQGLSNKTGGEASPMGNFSTGARPSLSRSARNGGESLREISLKGMQMEC